MNPRRTSSHSCALALVLASSGACSIRRYTFPDVGFESDATAEASADASDASTDVLPRCDASLSIMPMRSTTLGGVTVTLTSQPADTWTGLSFDGIPAMPAGAANQFIVPRHRAGSTTAVATNGTCTARDGFAYELVPLALAPRMNPRSGWFDVPSGIPNQPADVEIGTLNAAGGVGILVVQRSSPGAVQMLRRISPGVLDWVPAPPQPTAGSDFRDATITSHGDIAIARYYGGPLVFCDGTSCRDVGTGSGYVAVSSFDDGPDSYVIGLTAHSDATVDSLTAFNTTGSITTFALGADLDDRRLHRLAVLRSSTGPRIIVALPDGANPDHLVRYSFSAGAIGNTNNSIAALDPAVVLAALDRDGDGFDEAVAIGGANGSVSRWNPATSMGIVPVGTISATQPAIPMWVGDLNGDGTRDIAFALYDTPTVGILLGDGQSGFAAAQQIDVGGDGCQHARTIAAGVLAPGERPVVVVGCVRAQATGDGGMVDSAGVVVLETR